jgi:hypothetical protein
VLRRCVNAGPVPKPLADRAARALRQTNPTLLNGKPEQAQKTAAENGGQHCRKPGGRAIIFDRV